MSHSSLYNKNLSSEVARKLDTEKATEIFTFSAYLKQETPVDVASSNLGSTWDEVDALAVVPPTPRGIQGEASGRFSFLYPGVYFLTVTGAFEHNSSNGGRMTNFRVYDYTTATPGVEHVVPTGRNAEATTINLNGIYSIESADIGSIFGLQIGGGDAYSSIVINIATLSIFNIGPWQL